MDSVDAYKVLASELEAYRALGYNELSELVGQHFSHRPVSNASIEFEVTIYVYRLDCPPQHILVAGTVGITQWGGPHCRADAQFVVPPPVIRNVAGRQ